VIPVPGQRPPLKVGAVRNREGIRSLGKLERSDLHLPPRVLEWR
jgi:hypothetical protein